MLENDGEMFFKSLVDIQWDSKGYNTYRSLDDIDYLRKSDTNLRDLIEGKPND